MPRRPSISGPSCPGAAPCRHGRAAATSCAMDRRRSSREHIRVARLRSASVGSRTRNVQSIANGEGMSYIKVTAEELQNISGSLKTASDNIQAENARAMSQVTGLVGQGWEGAASDQFNQL